MHNLAWDRGLLHYVVAIVLWAVTVPLAFADVEADLLLKGGKLHLGDGSPGQIGDVAIQGDKIVAVGTFEVSRVKKTIDCSGLIVAPGFIDLHNHSDNTIRSNSGRAPRILTGQTRDSTCFLTQGCTTIVTGNCGGGVLDTTRYYERLDKSPTGVNVAHLIPHGSVRRKVIGSSMRAPRDGEMEEMKRLVRDQMKAGAWGMSTGLTYVPSSYAKTTEIAELASVVAEFNGVYASHIRNEGDGLLDAVNEAIEIGSRSGAAVHISHFKASGHRNWGNVRPAAKTIQAAIDKGQRVTADQYPYAASSTSVAAMLLPTSEREGSRKDLTRRLRDPEELSRLRPIIERRLNARGAIMLASCRSKPEWVGKLIRDIATEEDESPTDIAIEIIATGSESGVSFSMDEGDVRWVMTLPWVATASDGSVRVKNDSRPHPRSFGTFPRRIGRYAIEERVVPVESAVRSATGLPADILGIDDRGYLRAGLVADIVAFAPETFRDLATFESPFEESTGVRWLLVNGKLAIADGQLQDVTAGRPLRKVAAEAR